MTADPGLLAELAIRRTMARYTINGDRNRVADLAETFATGGILEFSGELLQGRQAILARLTGGRRGRPPGHSFSRHYLGTSLIEVDGESAVARTYFQVLTDIGIDHHGRYEDRLTRIAGTWLFAHRQVRIDWQSAQSFYPPMPISID